MIQVASNRQSNAVYHMCKGMRLSQCREDMLLPDGWINRNDETKVDRPHWLTCSLTVTVTVAVTVAVSKLLIASSDEVR